MERSQDRFGVWAIIPKDGGLEGRQTFTDYQEWVSKNILSFPSLNSNLDIPQFF